MTNTSASIWTPGSTIIRGFPDKGSTQLPITGQVDINGTKYDAHIQIGYLYISTSSNISPPVNTIIDGFNLTYSIA